MSSLLKLPFIAIVATSIHIISSRPNPPVPKKERVGSKLRETIILQITRVKFLLWVPILFETVLILAENFWPGLIRSNPLYLTSLSATGALAIVAGAFIRLRCYKALGPLFTFELTIRDNHKLVKHGPYGIVRHPSYSGASLSALGVLLWYFTPGSFLVDTTTWASNAFTVLLLTLFLFGVSLRANEEDTLLRQRFGVEWEDWAGRVPYKLVPYLY